MNDHPLKVGGLRLQIKTWLVRRRADQLPSPPPTHAHTHKLVGSGTPREAAERAGIILFRICLEDAATAVLLIIVGAGIGMIVAAALITPAP